MVFQGYWDNEAATKEMIDHDGWLHTGDLGTLDDEGFLAITGRKKDLIITSAGKNVAPAVLEDRLRAHWLVSDCLVVGDTKPYIAALVAGDPESFAQWRADNGKPETATIGDAILDEEFTEAGGQLTPTMKVRRSVVMEQYAVQIAALYDDRPR
jgi:long-chain acyl-CoA synthetase